MVDLKKQSPRSPYGTWGQFRILMVLGIVGDLWTHGGLQKKKENETWGAVVVRDYMQIDAFIEKKKGEFLWSVMMKNRYEM